MSDRFFQLGRDDREIVAVGLKEYLSRLPNVLFAYLHGSFVASEKFRDIDVALFLGKAPFSSLDFELDLEAKLSGSLPYPVDIRVLNNAPLSFRYNVIRYGKPLIVFDDNARCEFEEAAFRDYFDFAPFRKMYLKETLGLGT